MMNFQSLCALIAMLCLLLGIICLVSFAVHCYMYLRLASNGAGKGTLDYSKLYAALSAIAESAFFFGLWLVQELPVIRARRRQRELAAAKLQSGEDGEPRNHL